jgi:hypothetical protein
LIWGAYPLGIHHIFALPVASCDRTDLKNSAPGLAEYVMRVAVSSADRDLFFRDCGLVAGSGASAGSLRARS